MSSPTVSSTDCARNQTELTEEWRNDRCTYRKSGTRWAVVRLMESSSFYPRNQNLSEFIMYSTQTHRGGLASFRRKSLLGSSLEETVAKAFCKLCEHSQMGPKKALPLPWPWPRKGPVNLLSLTQRLCEFPWVRGTGVLLINTCFPKTTSASHNTAPWNIACPGIYKSNCPFALPSATCKRNREIRSLDTLKKSHSSEFLRKGCSVNTKPIQQLIRTNSS